MGGGWKVGDSVAEKEKGKSRDAGRKAGMEIVLEWKWECGAYVACTFEHSAYVSAGLFSYYYFVNLTTLALGLFNGQEHFTPLSQKNRSVKLRIVGKYIKGRISILDC
jgi:hypothetical protein